MPSLKLSTWSICDFFGWLIFSYILSHVVGEPLHVPSLKHVLTLDPFISEPVSVQSNTILFPYVNATYSIISPWSGFRKGPQSATSEKQQQTRIKMIVNGIFLMSEAVTELLVAWTPENSASRPSLVIALAGAPPLLTQDYKWVPVNFGGNLVMNWYISSKREY